MDKKQLEASARKLCELRGLDPDERVSHGNPDGRSLNICFSPRWELIVGEIESTYQVLEAIKYGQDTES